MKHTFLAFIFFALAAIVATAQSTTYQFVTVQDTLYLRQTTTFKNPRRVAQEDIQITDTTAFAEQLKNTAFNLAVEQAGAVRAALFLREGTAQYGTLATLYEQLTGTALFVRMGLDHAQQLYGNYSLRDTASQTQPVIFARAANNGRLQVASAATGGDTYQTQLYAYNGTNGRWRIRYNFGTTQAPDLRWLDFFYAGKNNADRDYWLTTDRRYRLTRVADLPAVEPR